MEKKWVLALVAGVLAVVAGGVAWVVLGGVEREEQESRQDRDERESAPEARSAKRDRPRHSGQVGERQTPAPVHAKKVFEGRRTRPASGPLRFVARFGEGRPFRPEVDTRDEAEARALAESVRSKVLGGEDPVALIRGLSDPPSGLPVELVSRHESLRPGEASEVIEVPNGFAVFFGGVPRPPE